MEENKDIQGEEISEEQLDGVAGGATWNRYDPKTCKNMTRTKYECVGLARRNWCDHYREKCIEESSSVDKRKLIISCAKGAYPEYIGKMNGDPV